MKQPIAPIALLAVAMLSACGDDGVSPKPRHSRLAILPDSASTAAFSLGDTVRLEARRLDDAGTPLAGDTARFVWESSDTTVVIVDTAGQAAIVGLGSATVTLRVADPAAPSLPSASDTASARVTLVASPTVLHPGPLLTASTGNPHRCVLLTSGRAECLGANQWGQVGIGTQDPVTEWSPVAGGLTFSTISVAWQHTCGMSTGGTVFCWGANSRGQLGLGGKTPWFFPEPIAFAPQHEWSLVHARGHSQTCGITTDQVPMCVGHNDFGQVGRLPITDQDTVVAEYGTGLRMTRIVTDDFGTCGIHVDGSVYCTGRAGPPTNTAPNGVQAIPTRIGGSVVFTDIAIGYWHGCGIDAGGTAYCWGYNEEGQLGTGNLEASGTAVPVAGGLRFARIYAFDQTSCGVTTAGETWCWGQNGGRGGSGGGTVLGRTRLERSTVPIRIPIGLGAHSIDRHGSLWSNGACAVDGQGKLICW